METPTNVTSSIDVTSMPSIFRTYELDILLPRTINWNFLGLTFKGLIVNLVTQWLSTCARKPKVPGSSPTADYVQSWALCSNRPANVCLWSGWKWYWGVNEIPSPLPLHSCDSWMFLKENSHRKKNCFSDHTLNLEISLKDFHCSHTKYCRLQSYKRGTVL